MVLKTTENVDHMKRTISLALCLLLFIACQSRAAAFHFVDGDGVRDLYFGDAPIWRDMIKYAPADRDATYKPYKHVYGFGENAGPVTKGPGGLYPHPRGVFLGFKTQFGD